MTAQKASSMELRSISSAAIKEQLIMRFHYKMVVGMSFEPSHEDDEDSVLYPFAIDPRHSSSC